MSIERIGPQAGVPGEESGGGATETARSPKRQSVLIPSEADSGAIPRAAPIGTYTLAGSTANFDVYYDDTLGSSGQTLANAVLAQCEGDWVQLQILFPGVSHGRFSVFIDPGAFGAFHAGCTDTDLHCAAFSGDDGELENFLNVAEADEVMMSGYGWNCAASNGEGLSRVVATELHPGGSSRFLTAHVWVNSARPDWVTQTEGTDRDKVSIGCATLFLNYLRHQLNFSLATITQAGGTNFQQTYRFLTGLPDAWGPFAALIQLHFPAGTPTAALDNTDNPFPLRVPASFDLTLVSGAPGAVGRPFGYFFGVNVAVYHGTDGHLHDLYWSGAPVGHDELTILSHAPAPAGNPFAYVFDPQGVQVVVYRGVDGHLHDLYWPFGAGPVGHDDLTHLSGAPAPAGDPHGYVVHAQGIQVVVYRGIDGRLHDLYWSTGAVGHDDLTALSHAPAPAGDPFGYVFEAQGVQVVVYRGVDGHLHDLYWSTGAVGHDDLTALSQAPAPAGDPSAYFVAVDGTYHVVYRSSDGHLRELRWTTGAVTHNDLTIRSAAPLAADDPSAYFVPDDATHHVIYRSPDGHVHELRWSNLTPF